ncbi:MAG: WYL domain-containing protein [Methylobacter sp.]|uniref:helix-turn-helix transcriptional regulator n=1 Tax=Methylobacter sp. TaxID=2051955 RepID=UPI0025883BD9|nr:WYL domain-containing protein [Methylobacter sp.]MCL7419500.1 WYL domain-containing protein [Methylobacter sp.]
MQYSLKWEQRQRLTLLEATVFWSGGVSTNALTDNFGISRVQASKDLTLYQALCPGNLRYDKYLKRYVIEEAFKPAFMEGTAKEFLQVLKAQRDGVGGAIVTLVNNLPVVELVESAVRQINRAVLRTVNQAIIAGREVRVVYQSMSRAEPVELWLSPHALVFDGLRWHTRAFSRTHGEFRDFVVARVLSAELIGLTDIDAADDVDWQLFVTVKIGPHPGLSESQKAIVEFDYAMRDGILECQVRAALVFYFLKAMRIGPDDLMREAFVQQIILLNRAELKDYLF